MCQSVMLSSCLRAALTPLDQHCVCLHPPTRGWAAHPTPQEHGYPVLSSGHTAVAEDERGKVHTRDVERGAVAKAEVITEVNSHASRLGEHLGQRQGDRSRVVEPEARVMRIIPNPLPPHLEKHGCLGSNPVSAIACCVT